MNNPLISVIIPVYKVEEYLDRCVQSVIDQIYSNLEIILIDDGSPDSCPKICDSWVEKDCRIKVLHKENGGLSSARNAGLDICKGDYISFLDSDDWIEPNYYSTIMPLLQENHAEVGCVGRYDVDGETLSRKIGLCPFSTRTISPKEMIKKILTWNECDSSVCDKVFASVLWSNIRFPVGTISEDVAVAYKVLDQASAIVLLHEPMYNYFHRKGSITTSVFSSKSIQVIMLAEEILEYVKTVHPDILAEAKYFKFKTLLHWNRAYAKQTNHSQAEKNLRRSSRMWLWKQFFFVWFSSRYICLKDKLWYVLIILGMNRVIRWRIG